MRVLAVETSCPPGSIALLEGEQTVAHVWLDNSQRTVQTLFPELERLLSAAGWRSRDVQLVAVTIGPGSFTGLRIGVTFAKTWAFATRAAVQGLPTLDVIAEQAVTEHDDLWVLLDAQRRQLFARHYRRAAGGCWQPMGAVEILGRDQWLSQVAGPCAVTGEGLGTIQERHASWGASGAPIEVLPSELWRPSAETVGRMAQKSAQNAIYDDFLRLAPYYCRRSAAEEKADQRA